MKTFMLSFTEQELSYLQAAIQELPMKYGVPLVQKINAEIVRQSLPATSPPNGEEKDVQLDG